MVYLPGASVRLVVNSGTIEVLQETKFNVLNQIEDRRWPVLVVQSLPVLR